MARFLTLNKIIYIYIYIHIYIYIYTWLVSLADVTSEGPPGGTGGAWSAQKPNIGLTLLYSCLFWEGI